VVLSAIEESMSTNRRELRLLTGGGAYFESPRWHNGRWYVSDVHGGRVLSVTENAALQVILEHEDLPCGLGWTPSGELLVTSMGTACVLKVGTGGAVNKHADVADVLGAVNDMVVAADGTAYVGGMAFDLTTGLPSAPAPIARISPDGEVSVAADGLRMPNGMVLLNDGAVLVVAESFASRLIAFDVADGGTLSGRREWARLAPGVLPDGIADAGDDSVWVADAGSGRVMRVYESGPVEEMISPPGGLKFFAVARGGESGRTLLLCAAPDFDADARRATREAVLFSVDIATSIASA
jgi:sugar lactone lactonase YvrE